MVNYSTHTRKCYPRRPCLGLGHRQTSPRPWRAAGRNKPPYMVFATPTPTVPSPHTDTTRARALANTPAATTPSKTHWISWNACSFGETVPLRTHLNTPAHTLTHVCIYHTGAILAATVIAFYRAWQRLPVAERPPTFHPSTVKIALDCDYNRRQPGIFYILAFSLLLFLFDFISFIFYHYLLLFFCVCVCCFVVYL
jgi:hypothetical protein